MDNGSPIDLVITRLAKVRRDNQFSLNYYITTGGKQREMRNSANLVVDADLTNDIIVDGKRYELMYVDFNDRHYRIVEILRYYKSGLRKILDIQELK